MTVETEKRVVVEAVTESRWRETYADDPRQLVGVSISDNKLSCEVVTFGLADDDGEPAPALTQKTKSPMLYFPDEIDLLLRKLTMYAIKICEFPDSDIEVLEVKGVHLSHSATAGSVPKVQFSVVKQVLADNNFWPFKSPKVYLKGIEGSSLALPEGGDHLIESLRLHCLRAIDGDFPLPAKQLELIEATGLSPVEAGAMLDE